MRLIDILKSRKNVVWRDKNGVIDCPGDKCPKECDVSCPIWCLTVAIQSYQAKRYPDAISYLKMALDIAPDYKEAWNNLGAVYGQMGNHVEAKKAYEKALFNDPNYRNAQFGLIISCIKLKQYREALGYCNQYEKIVGKTEADKLRKSISDAQMSSADTAEAPRTPSLQERYGEASIQGHKKGNWGEVANKYRQLEEEGLGEASIALGQLVQAHSSSEALYHFRNAAEKGIAEGAWGVAAILGHQYIPDIDGADKEWYHFCLQSARAGCCDAQHELGNIYSRQKKYLSAFYWFTLSGYYEHPDGHFDASKVIEMWESDGRPTVEPSQWNVAEDLEDGLGKLAENAFLLWQIHTGEKELTKQVLDSMFYLSAMHGSEIVGLFLGHLYEDHNVFAQSKLAYQVAANSGSIMGMKCLGDMLAVGRGCERDMEKAASWYRLASNKGEKTACFIMGEFFRRTNPNLAAYYYAMAFRRGYEPALVRIQRL